MLVTLFDVDYIHNYKLLLINCSTLLIQDNEVIMSLQQNNEPLPIPSSGTRTRGSKRYIHTHIQNRAMHSSILIQLIVSF